MASLDIPERLAFELIVQVDDYVFGFVLRERQEREERERGFSPEALEFFQRELDSGEYPLLTRYLGEDVNAGVDRIAELIADEARFDRGLRRLLDGFEAELGPRGKSRGRSDGRNSSEGRSRSKGRKSSK